MENIEETMNRINIIWENADDKVPLAESFGFTGDSFMSTIDFMVEGPYTNSLSKYIQSRLESGADLESAAMDAQKMALADYALVMMMLGRERERLERQHAAG